MNENTNQISDETTSDPTSATEAQAPRRAAFATRRRRVVTAASAVAVVAAGLGGYALHQHGVQAGEARADRVATTEWEALQARGDARVEAAKRESRLPDYMRVGAGVTAAEGKLFAWTDTVSGCRFIRTPSGAIHWDVGPTDLREVTGELPTKGCHGTGETVPGVNGVPIPAPAIVTDHVTVGGECVRVLRIGGQLYTLPDRDGDGPLQLAPAEAAEAVTGCRVDPDPNR